MLSISRKSDYGLLLLTLIARSSRNRYLSLKQLSVKNRLPYKFISQIASRLAAAGILKSREGLRGGYRLNHKPEEINVAKVLEILEGSVVAATCQSDKKCACQNICLHQKIMTKVSSAITQTMQQYSLADLVRGNSA
ncbi:hypothetical protein A3A66_03115 [Microgenomates group bacterium RIFCSPLOWO2_01_FULL_46_13]|nr:MAG: hypothetical protein A2783_04890 [Microgenomates group bacterium RIFCSPHIGHO2_01_FULL_45_11]OGV94144.1 MAG: hypothetical protein A3A66_03115 [Microgenomates group bacterium RIFCSPLOWO2_01_FULL_46_13]